VHSKASITARKETGRSSPTNNCVSVGDNEINVLKIGNVICSHFALSYLASIKFLRTRVIKKIGNFNSVDQTGF
jgi:hypothetical protein